MENKIEKINVKLAFKVAVKGCGIVGKTISWWTKSKYYHIELIFGDYWISSNAECGGVTISPLAPLKHTWEYHDLGDIEITTKQLEYVKEFIKQQEGKKYDWLGIVCSQTLPFNWHSKNKWFCSEIVTKLLQLLTIKKAYDVDPNSMSPGDVARLFGCNKE